MILVCILIEALWLSWGFMSDIYYNKFNTYDYFYDTWCDILSLW